MPADISTKFTPDYTPEQLENLGVYDALYRGQGPRLASLGEWKPEWISEHDPKGWAQWYKRYSGGRRLPEEDERQIKRWASFKARHGGPFTKNPTPRRGWALRNWGVDPSKLVAPDQSQATTEMLDEYQRKAMQKYVQGLGKQAAGPSTGLDLNSFKFKAAPASPPPLESPPQNPQAYEQWKNTAQIQASKLPIPAWIKNPGVGMRATFSSQPQRADQPYSSAYDPSVQRTTLGAQIGRWYQNAGGLNNAINKAQTAQQNRDTTVLDPKLWSSWRPEAVTQQRQPVITSQSLLDNRNNNKPAAGALTAAAFQTPAMPETETYTPTTKSWFGATKPQKPVQQKYVSEPAVVMPSPPSNKVMSQSLLEHELSHGAFPAAGEQDRDMASAFLTAGPARNPEQFGPDYEKQQREQYSNQINYLSEPAEVDVRLAEIKRRYAHHTGNLVETPAQAQNAWDWWRQNRALMGMNRVDEDAYNQDETQLKQIAPENIPAYTPSDLPTLNTGQFEDYYDRLPDDQKQKLFHRMPELVQQQNANAYKFGAAMAKEADLNADVQLQDHQQRISDRVTGDDPRMLVYHGLGSGKSLSALAAAEAAKKIHGGSYGIVVPASLRGNFHKEVKKFTRNSSPEIMSYTGLGMGKNFKEQPDTLIMDEAARLRNPNSAMTQAAMRAARDAKRVMLLTGTPITNSPTDLAPIVSMLQGKNIDPKSFGERYVGYEKVKPGWLGWLKGVKPGQRPYIKNEQELRGLLQGRVDYQPSKTPEGVNVNEEIVRTPLSKEQQKIQQAIRTTVPPGFLWKLDQEFPLSKDELARLNGFLTGMRQVGLSTQPFRADKNPLKAFDQSSKLTTAMKNLRKTLDEDPRKKALIYSNFVDAGISPYAAALERDKIPYGIFHGSIPTAKRQQALQDYNEGKLRALLLGPAAAEGISTKGTSLIQLLDPHWNESRLQQAKGRGLRFDSHDGLPEELKNVAVQRYLNQSEEPGMARKYLFGKKRERTGDEVLERLTGEKEQFNEKFRNLLREIGTPKPEEKAARAFGQAMKRALDTTLPKPPVAPVKPPKDQSLGNETWTAPIAASFISDAPTRGNALPLTPAGQPTPPPNQNSGKPAQTASNPV